MACDCVAEINAAINTIENSIQAHTDVKADQVRDYLYNAISGWFNTQYAWDNDHGPTIDNINSQGIATAGNLSTFILSTAGSFTAVGTHLNSMQDTLNESIEATEDIVTYLRDISFPNAIGTLENHIENHTDVKSDQIRDHIENNAIVVRNTVIADVNAFTDADGGNTRNYLADQLELKRASLHADIVAVGAQVTALAALVSSVVTAGTSRDWTLNP